MIDRLLWFRLALTLAVVWLGWLAGVPVLVALCLLGVYGGKKAWLIVVVASVLALSFKEPWKEMERAVARVVPVLSCDTLRSFDECEATRVTIRGISGRD